VLKFNSCYKQIEQGEDTYEYLMMRSGYGWLARAATSWVTATWDLLPVAGDVAHSWVPTGTTSVDGGDSGLIGNTTNMKHDFVGIAVSGIVYKAFHITVIRMQLIKPCTDTFD